MGSEMCIRDRLIPLIRSVLKLTNRLTKRHHLSFLVLVEVVHDQVGLVVTYPPILTADALQLLFIVFAVVLFDCDVLFHLTIHHLMVAENR